MKALSVVLSLVAVMALALAVQAEEKGKAKGKEVTLTGTVTCAKCDLKESDACHTVIKVKEEGKDVVYWFDDTSSKANHKAVCTSPTMGKVTGTVSEKDGKKWIKVSKVNLEG